MSRQVASSGWAGSPAPSRHVGAYMTTGPPGSGPRAASIAARAGLADAVQAEGLRALELALRRREPHEADVVAEALPGQPEQGQRTFARPDAGAEDPDPIGPWHDEGGQGAQ